MKLEIKADEEGNKVIQALCDLALKQGGLQNMQAVTLVLQSVKPIEEKEEE